MSFADARLQANMAEDRKDQRIADLEGIIFRHVALSDVDTPEDRAEVLAIVQKFRKSKHR